MIEKKKIGIEQYIPFELINATILEYLETKDINKDELFQRMLEYNKGENRAKKSIELYLFCDNKDFLY